MAEIQKKVRCQLQLDGFEYDIGTGDFFQKIYLMTYYQTYLGFMTACYYLQKN